MSFQRPHAPIAPAAEHFDMYNPDEMVLPDSAVDYFERRFAGKPEFMQERLADGCGYPLADPEYADVRFDLLAQLMRFTLQYRTDTGRSSHEKSLNKRFAPTNLVHKGRRYWRDLKEAYTKETVWPPGD